jgi:hypothetical protein
VTTGFNIESSPQTQTDLSVEVPAISMSEVELNSIEYQEILLPAGDFLTQAETSEEGKPSIPALTTLVIIPDHVGIRINVSYSGYDVFDNILVAPVQPAQPESDPTPVPFAIDNEAYATDAFYPGELAEAGDPAIMRDVRFTQIALYPVQYNPARQELRVYRDLSVSISYDGEIINPKIVRHRYLSDGFYPIYQGLFSNFDQFFGTAQVKRGGYVIIAKRNFADSLRVDSLLQAVAMWKHQKGYYTRIVPTTEINSNGSPTYQQIKTYLTNAYESWESPPEYVMLIGDQDGTHVVNDYPYSSYASDHEYACLEGTDFLPEIFVGRMSVDNMSDLRKAMAKIFKYERNPQMFDPQHWVRGFSIGYTWYATARLTTLWVRQLQLQHGFVRVDSIFGDTYNSNVLSYLNAGRGLVQYRGAGGSSGWWGPSFDISNLNSMQNNQKMTIMAILTCGTGDFGEECLGEEWLQAGLNPDSLKGGPAYYGVSDHYTHTKWNNPIMMGYYWGMFAENAYHFGPAAIRGKLQQYMTFPRQRNSEVRLYFHTYNMLGDPELEIRTKVPIYVNVTYDDSVALGLNHYEINVTDSTGNPIEGAFVSLIKNRSGDEEELFSVEKTDENGNAVLFFDADTTGTMALTVSGQNLYPVLTNVEVITSDIAVGADSVAFDDDNAGYSQGNADGQPSPNETIELTVALKNFGTNMGATNVVATLESLDEHLQVYENTRNYGDIAPGMISLNTDPFIVHVTSSARDGEVYRFKLNVTDLNNDTWFSLIEVPVAAPKLIVSRIDVTDENNRLDHADTASIILNLTNMGSLSAETVTGHVTTEDDFTSVLIADCEFGSIPVDSTNTNASTPISLATSATIFDGHSANLMLHLMTAAGFEASVPFSVKIDTALTSDPTGPDAYGYYMYDNTDTSYAPHPTYSWVGIAPSEGGTGTRLNYGSNTDDKSVLVSMPFDLIYFGHAQREIIVSINGFVALDTFRMDMGGNYWANFFNWPIPDPGNAAGQISPFWDDLSFTGNNYGVFTWHDTTNHLFIIEWYHTVNRNGGQEETFQMIISDPAYHSTISGDSEILFQYGNIYNNGDSDENYSSVGIEDPTETIGLQYTYDRSYPSSAAQLASGRAIMVTTNTGDGAIRGTVDLDNGGQNGGVTITTSTDQIRTTSEDGGYWLKHVPPSVVSVTAQTNGYFPMTIDSVSVEANRTVGPVDLALAPCPVPQNFTATDSMDTFVGLSWDAVTHGNLVGYDVYRDRWQNGEHAKLNPQPITNTSYIDNAVGDSGIYWYYVVALYAGSGWTAQSFASNDDAGRLLQPVGASDGPRVPAQFFLAQNYPNPFNPTTAISYGLPEDSHVKIDIFNLLGQRVLTLLDEPQKAGYRQVVWDGMDSSGKAVASGMYLYRLKTDDKVSTRKMTMLK